MSKPLRISAKKLGAVAMPDFCPRCFWTVMRLKGKFPYFIFPSIFGIIDVYTKYCMQSFFDRVGRPPKCLCDLGEIIEYVEPPTHHTFQILTGQNILLTGSPDAVFKLADSTLLICDYKTAQPKGLKDPLYEIYRIQLNVYALLAQKTGLGQTSKLALLYTVPQVSLDDAKTAFNAKEDSISMNFKFHTHEVPLDLPSLDKLLTKAKTLYDLPKPPEGRKGCQDCAAVEQLYAVLYECEDPVQAYATIFGTLK